MTKIKTKLEKLEKALISLEMIYLKPNTDDRTNIDATIQRFEFTFELFWKLLKAFFDEKGLEIYYPRDVLKQAYQDHIITDEVIWLQMLKDRNLTSHTYDAILADTIFSHIKLYVPILRKAVDVVSNLINNQKKL